MSREVCGICWCPYDEKTGECACAPEPKSMELETKVTTCTYPHCKGGKYGVFCYERCHRMCHGAGREECRRCWRRTESNRYPLIQPWAGHGSCPDKIPEEQK